MRRRWVSLAAIAYGLWACDGDAPHWQIVDRDMPAALLSVWGTSASDVYAVGGDVNDGRGPMVVHWDGTSWTRLPTGQSGNLWWVFGTGSGPLYMGGDGGMILRFDGTDFTRMTTPGTETVFGIWGASDSDLWAVGGAAGGANGGFAWRLVGDSWQLAPGFPASITANDAIWKISGRSANDVWMVGTDGAVVRWDGSSLVASNAGIGESLFTVHASAERFVAVGGFVTGIVLENDGTTWRDASPQSSPGLIGVYQSPSGTLAVGQEGSVFQRDGSTWSEVATGITIEQSLHSVWVDPSGGVWAVGGQVQTLPLIDGVMLYAGEQQPGELPR
jgi:hypothetical protein